MQIKKVLSVLLVAVMLLSVMPLSAFANTYDSDFVEMRHLQVGDVITSGVEVIIEFEQYTVTLKAGGYCAEWQDEAETTDIELNDCHFYDGRIEDYYPVDNSGNKSDRWYVVAIDTEVQTIALTGCEPIEEGEPHTVTIKANGNTISKEFLIPHKFSCNFSNRNGELDQIIKELYGITEGFCLAGSTPTVSGTTAVEAGNSNHNQYFTINEPFIGKATVSLPYYGVDNTKAELEIYFPELTHFYTVTWKNADGTLLETDTDVVEGTVPTYNGATPTKADDAQYTYTFKGWTPEVSAVTGNVTYTAVYSQSVRQYTVTWKNYDDSVIGTSTVNAGQTPEFSDSIGQIKAKPADENHSYEFTGWTPEIVAAEADAEYTATFVDVLSISNVDEWNSFAASVKDGNTYSGKIVRMTADVGPVTTMVAGTFSGTFDGGSHTLTVNISGGNASVATFEVVKDATIQNLTLAGSITSSGIHSAALVKSISDSGTSCTIKNVDIYADVNCSNNYLGGVIGHAGTANTVNIENSIFAGSINKTGSGQGGYIGGFIGWSQQLTATIDNCAFTGSYSNIKSFNNIGFSYNAPTKITVNVFYSNVSEVFGTSANHGTRLYTPSSSYPTTVALVNHGGEKTFFHQLSDALNAWVDGSTLMLMSDVTTASTISVGGNKTLDLNGYKLRISRNAQVISVQEGGDLTIKSSAQGGEVIGCNADRAVVGGKGQTLTLESGTIKTAASNCISGTDAVFNLNGGAIEGTSNSSDMTVASAVYCKGNCTVNWNGTSITTNTGCGFYSKTTTDTVKIGGGSFAATADTLPDNAGYALANYNVEIQGAPVLNGKGIYLSNGRVINVTGELTNDVPIGVVMQTPGVFTSGLQGNGGIANFANGNGDDYGIGLNASGEAQVVRKYTVTWKLDETTVLDTDKVMEGTVPTFTGTAPADYSDTYYNYTFAGWTPEVTAVTGDVTYTATYTATEIDVLPTVTAVDSTAQGYDTAYEYTYANDGSAKYANYYGDITVSFDRAIEADDVVLAGAYDNFQSGAWTPVTLRNLAAGEEFRIVKDGLVGSAVTFAKLIAITGGDFRCAAKGIDVAGVTMTVKFNLYATKTSTEPIEIASGTKTFTFPEANNGANLALEGTIEENIYMDAAAYGLAGKDSDAVIRVNYNASTNISETAQEVTDVYNVKDLTAYDDPKDEFDGTYKFSFKQAPAQITEDVTVALYENEDAETPVKTIEYSTKDYCDNVIATSNDVKLVALCKSILDYGAAAQEEFNYNTDNMAVDEFYNADAIQALSYSDISGTTLTDTLGVTGCAFQCLANTNINLYIDNPLISADIQASLEGENESAIRADYMRSTKTGRLFISVNGIAADDMTKNFTVVTSNGTVTTNLNTIVKTCLYYGTATTLAKTIYFYANAADAYFN